MKKIFLRCVVVFIFLFILSQLSITVSAKGVSDSDTQKAFTGIVARYSDINTANKFWSEAAALYSGSDRHYHTLKHLDNFYSQLLKCRVDVKDWETLVIAMVYHDVIYNSTDHKDEERSADMAVERLTAIGFPAAKVAFAKSLILATKAHALSEDNDTNLFNDADMSILGLDRDTYATYVKNVRIEYGATPAFDKGRKRVLNYFLGMERIFKTDTFYKLYEKSARENISWEISTIN